MKNRVIIIASLLSLILILAIVAANFGGATDNPQSDDMAITMVGEEITLVDGQPLTAEQQQKVEELRNMPPEIHKVKIKYDYDIPDTPEEIEAIKAEQREKQPYLSNEEILGKDAAEKILDDEIKEAIQYRIDMNKKGVSDEEVDIVCMGC